MKPFVKFLADIVRKSPWGVIAGTLVVTVVFGAFLPQMEQASGNEGFSPDSPEWLAQDVISEHFQDSSEEPVQIVVEARDGDLLTADGLRDYLAIRAAIESSEAATLMKGRPGGDIVGYFDALLIGLEMRAQEMGVPFDTLVQNVTDEDVKQGLLQSLDQIPAEFRELTLGLYGSSSDMTVPKAETAIMVVFLNVADLDDPDLTILQGMEVDMAERISAAPTVVSDGTAFSFALLFADTDDIQAEIGQLFMWAFYIIVAILLFVFWIHPKGKLTRLLALRKKSNTAPAKHAILAQLDRAYLVETCERICGRLMAEHFAEDVGPSGPGYGRLVDLCSKRTS